MMCMLNTHVQQIVANRRMTLCSTPDGRVFSVGKDFRTLNVQDERVLGIPRTFSLPVQISQMSIGRDHACLLSDNGRVFTFGSNQFGQLGVSTFNSRHFQPSTDPALISKVDPNENE
jgi:alpha-tubulin suppressor-like RCC1 family protein